MISVEQNFFSRFPGLAEGRVRTFSQPVVELLRRVTCEDRINRILSDYGIYSGFDFVERVLDDLQISYRVANTDRDNIPEEGRLIVVANHPLGALDALALMQLLGTVRRDVRILGNDILLQLKPMAPLLLPVKVLDDGVKTSTRMREAYRALDLDQVLVVFPAGEVSRIGAEGVRDGRWSTGFARLAKHADAAVLPVHISAYNSPSFYGLSMLAKPLSSLLLAREMFGASRTRIDMAIGEPIPATSLSGMSVDHAARSMRRHVYRLAGRKPSVFATSRTIAHPEAPLKLRDALRRAEVLGKTRDGKIILLFDAQPDCPLLREIGRLRELSFRRVGEGTGTRRDLDPYDTYYRHLVLWDENALAIVGAYRLGEGENIMRTRGVSGLYSSSLFDYSDAALEFLSRGVELGRSFVQPAFWGSRSLDYLWQGIGAYLRSCPQIHYLFGPVSLSAALPPVAREWIVHFHQHYYGNTTRLATARNTFLISRETSEAAARAWTDRDIPAGLAVLRERLATMNCHLPVLYRQYADLCEPDGVEFLGFGTDPAFGHCVDGLIRLDLSRLRPAKRERYLA